MTVYVAPGYGRCESYHTDPDCQILQAASRVDEREEVPKSWDVEECKFCAGTVERTGGDRSIFEAAKQYGQGGSA